MNISEIHTSLNDDMDRSWLNPRSKCFNLAHFLRLSTFANLFLLKSRVSTAGRSCKDSSINNKRLHAHETKDKRFQCGEPFISAILLANTCRKASCIILKDKHNPYVILKFSILIHQTIDQVKIEEKNWFTDSIGNSTELSLGRTKVGIIYYNL